MKTLTDQQKLEILCAYLPHGVEVEIIIKESEININPTQRLTINNIASLLYFNSRPTLRHPDDMTEEELVELCELTGHISNNITKGLLKRFIDPTDCYGVVLSLQESQSALTYLHSLHIDTFGAIEAGFAERKNINEKGE